MAKLKNPFFGFGASGSIARALSFRRRFNQVIAEKFPIPKDPKSAAQLSWRAMYLKAVVLWHALSPAEQADWHSLAGPKHMTGFAYFMSQCLKPNPGIYLPLIGGTMQGNVAMATNKITGLPQPLTDQEAATKKYVDDAGGGPQTKIIDANSDTKVDVEESSDEDIVRMDTAGVETFHLNAAGILSLVKQSACRVYQSSNQAFSHNTITLVNFDTTVFDIQSEFNLATDKFTATVSGLYFFSSHMAVSALNVNDYVALYLYKNTSVNTYTELRSYGTTITLYVHLSGIVQLAANDYLSVKLKQTYGASRNSYASSTRCFLSIAKIA